MKQKKDTFKVFMLGKALENRGWKAFCQQILVSQGKTLYRLSELFVCVCTVDGGVTSIIKTKDMLIY